MKALVRRLRRSTLYADSSLARERLGFVPVLSDIDTVIRIAAPAFRVEHRL
jgi:UDP-arabinose 4-epimerase